MATSYKRPTFIYHREVIEKNIRRLQSCMGDRAELFYSIKANPNPYVIQTMVENGLGLECSSSFELHGALQSGCDSQKIICIGPGKSEALLRQCIQAHIGAIYVESIEEIELIQRLCASLDLMVDIVLRVHLEKNVGRASVSMSGTHNPFGMDDNSIHAINQQHQQWDRCHFIGLHYYQGSKQKDPFIIQQHIQASHEHFRTWQAQWHRPLGMMGLGLGLDTLDDTTLETAICEPLAAIHDGYMALECGRCLVADAGQMLCQVQYTKQLNGEAWAILDTGYHHMMDMCFNTNYLRQYPHIQPLLKKEGAIKRYHIAGPLCTPSDRLHHAFESSTLQRGDFLLIHHVGAYAWNHSPLVFLGHAPPDQVFVDHERVHRSNPLYDFINYHKEDHDPTPKH